MKKPRYIEFLLAGMVAAALVGCGAGDQRPESLEDRAQARWDAMVAGEFEEAWSYYTPGYRETTPAADFAQDMRRRPVRWTGAEILVSDCEGDRCEVTARVSYRVPSAPEGISDMEPERHVRETWIRTRDQWWYAP